MYAPHDTAETRVKEGVAFLDTHAPGWRHRIDTDRLQIKNAGACMLGQLCGTYEKGCAVFGLDRGTDTGRLGFNATGDITFEELDDAWRRAVHRVA